MALLQGVCLNIEQMATAFVESELLFLVRCSSWLRAPLPQGGGAWRAGPTQHAAQKGRRSIPASCMVARTTMVASSFARVHVAFSAPW